MQNIWKSPPPKESKGRKNVSEKEKELWLKNKTSQKEKKKERKKKERKKERKGDEKVIKQKKEKKCWVLL